jgi:signal transduction histidine kinase/ActR/RegA family two-component response regulator
MDSGIAAAEQHDRTATATLGLPARLEALRKTGLLSPDPEERFDRLTRLAARALGAPIALVSLITAQEQLFKSCYGLEGHPAGVGRRTPLNYSICKHAVISGEPLIISDARTHPLVRENAAISELGVIAYAGIPLVVESGDVIGSFCVIDNKPRQWTDAEIEMLADLAASVMTEINLQAAKEKAEAANRAKDRFLAILSHELRMPLSPSLMIADSMATDTSLPQSVRDDAALIKRNIQQQTHLIDDLLDITRIENDKLALHLHWINVHQVLKESVNLCAGAIQARRIDVTLELKASRPIVSGDGTRLRQVFGNLLKNAIKFTPPGGSVTLSTEDAARGLVRILVRDTGIGISPAILPTLFETFAQGSQSRTDEHGGLGLGLAICRGIVERHAGTIAASSEGDKKGTTVAVELPATSEQDSPSITPAPPLPQTTAMAAQAPRPVNILLVDDHEDTLRALSRLLRKLEHRVVTANCVKGALHAATEENFDLLISDVGLPDGTGLDLMKQLLGRQPIRGIALTGYGSDQDLKQTREAGFSAHLTKPIDFHALETAIRKVADDAR